MLSDTAGEYYDENVPRRLRDFIVGNRRIDAALVSLLGGLESRPKSVLEIGCGVGFVAWQAQKRWPHARVVGVDVSMVSIDVARCLFDDSGVNYAHGKLEELDLEGPFDLIVMMDVYEHVEESQRTSLHRQVDRLLDPRGSIFLSVPTPEYQQHLRLDRPEGLQPVDEDVTAADLEALAVACDATMVSYQKVSVWRRLDYAHCWLKRSPGAGSEPLHRATLRRRVAGRLGRTWAVALGERRRRARRVAKHLGRSWLEAAERS